MLCELYPINYYFKETCTTQDEILIKIYLLVHKSHFSLKPKIFFNC